MRHIMPIEHQASAAYGVTNVLSKLGNVDSKGCRAGLKGLKGVVIDVGVFVEAQTENFLRHGLIDTIGGISDLAGERFGVT